MKGLLDTWRARFSEKCADRPKVAEPGLVSGDVPAGLVFVDGHLDLAISTLPAGVIALPLEASLSSYGLFLQNRWTKLIQEEKEESIFLNGALARGSLFLYVPPKLTSTLHIHHIFTSKDLAMPRVEAILGKNASLSVTETYQSLVDHPSVNSAWIVTLEEGSNLSFLNQSLLSSASRSISSMRVQLKRDASFSHLFATRGGEVATQSIQVELAQENSSALMRAICMLDGQRHADCRILARHVAPNCRSRQHVKVALFDESRSNFEGKIYVEPEAQKTESYQLNQNLLLSNAAQAKSKPALEIFADDVKASHGAIVSQLGDEELFYLSSRGLSKQEARRLLVSGFCRELIDPSHAEILQEMRRWIK